MNSSAVVPDSAQLLSHFDRHVFHCWFPTCVDDVRGGFHQEFAEDWRPLPAMPRALVFQARMLWVLATVARRRPELATGVDRWISRGVDALQTVFWDAEYGGYLFEEGQTGEKHSYGMAFALYALAACCRMPAADPRYAVLARRTLDWWLENAFDESQGAFFDALRRDGRPLLESDRKVDLISVPYGLLAANTHIHAVEALTELWRATAWPDAGKLLQRTLEALESAIVRHDGRLFTTYSRNWQPANRTVSYGHDVEAAFLLLDARRALGLPASTLPTRLLDDGIRHGLDRRYGGLMQGRRRFRAWRQDRKIGWVQAEGLNSLATFAAEENDPARRDRWLAALANVWGFVTSHLTDLQHSGWFALAARDGTVLDRRKGHRWKACYHATRAVLNSAEALTRIERPGA